MTVQERWCASRNSARARHGVAAHPSGPQLEQFTPAVRLQAADFTIEHRMPSSNSMRNVFGKIRPGLEDMSVARDELAAMAPQVGPRSEAVNLRLEGELGVIERVQGWRRRRIRARSITDSISQGRPRVRNATVRLLACRLSKLVESLSVDSSVREAFHDHKRLHQRVNETIPVAPFRASLL